VVDSYAEVYVIFPLLINEIVCATNEVPDMSCENVRVARNYSPIAMHGQFHEGCHNAAFLNEIHARADGSCRSSLQRPFAPTPKLKTNAITKPTTSTQTTVEVSARQSVQLKRRTQDSSVVDSIFPETDVTHGPRTKDKSRTSSSVTAISSEAHGFLP